MDQREAFQQQSSMKGGSSDVNTLGDRKYPACSLTYQFTDNDDKLSHIEESKNCEHARHTELKSLKESIQWPVPVTFGESQPPVQKKQPRSKGGKYSRL